MEQALDDENAEESEEEAKGMDAFQLARLNRQKDAGEFAEKNGFTIVNNNGRTADAIYEKLEALENMTFTKA